MPASKPVTRTLFGRKLLVLFVLAALIPVTLGATVSYLQVKGSLSSQSTADLREDARNYGLLTLEKLTFADTILGSVSQQEGWHDPTMEGDSELSFWFSSIVQVDQSGTVKTVFGSPLEMAVLRQIAASAFSGTESRVQSIVDRHRRGHVFLSRAGHLAGEKPFVILAELSPRFIWGDVTSFPDKVNFCVVTDSGIALNCSLPVPVAVTGMLASFSESATASNIDWEMGGETYIGLGWHLFLQSRFDAENWSILAFKPSSAAFAVLEGFDNLYLKIALLSVLVVCFVSSIQIRRSLKPLEALVAGTQRLSRREFTTPIKVHSKDEFQGLAEAMNNMGSSLKAQFQSLELLSRIDQLILSSNSLPAVIEDIQQGLAEIVSCDNVAIGIRDQDADEFFLVDTLEAGKGGRTSQFRLAATEQLEALITLASSKARVADCEDGRGIARQLFGDGTSQVFLAAIKSGQVIKGFVALGTRQQFQQNDTELAAVNEFADRIAVALNAANQEEHLYKQAHFDSLTGLPNRQLFHDRLQQEINHARRDDRVGAVMFIDLDNFKRLNDSLGHSVGDELLKAAATRLKRCLRDDDTVARLGGDEFTVIISGIPGPAHAGNTADLILEEFSRPFDLSNGEHLVTASIGITMFPEDGTEVGRLLKNADTAMYRAKHEGRARRAFFEDSMHVQAVRRLELESDLRRALESGDQLSVHFQPQISIPEDCISGVEALVRWQHPAKGPIGPDEFISVAEDAGLIHDLGLWVLRKAVEAFRRWEDQGRDVGRICVNVSTRQFQQSTFASCVRTILLECGMKPRNLELEITESLLADERSSILDNIAEIQRMGIRLAIDDFGTGYSSLSYMRRFAFDTLKIDRGFVTDLPRSGEIAGITTAIVQMAHTLGKNVVAEGVEHAAQFEFLKSIGCDEVQGYMFAAPMDRNAFEDFEDEFKGSASMGANMLKVVPKS